MDIAASVQAVTEEVVLTMIRSLAKEYNIPNLCMAGGVALNCVANGKILENKIFDIDPFISIDDGVGDLIKIGWFDKNSKDGAVNDLYKED